MTHILVAFLLLNGYINSSDEARNPTLSIAYDAARSHEVQPHRRTIPMVGVKPGFNQLRLTIIVSPSGHVLKADASGTDTNMQFWAYLQGEVAQWGFIPFEANGHAVVAEVEEYIDLVPPERLPRTHVSGPIVRPDSNVTVTLERSGCDGVCPSYTVEVSTTGIAFEGRNFVVAEGRHTDSADADEVRNLAKHLVETDFYSMDDKYIASVTDNPTYVLTASIDGHRKQVVDYVGAWEGMPAILSQLEDSVDLFAQTQRWVAGDDGLVRVLKTENFDFQTVAAQRVLKEAASRGKTITVQQLLEVGVPMKPISPDKVGKDGAGVSLEQVGLLTSASQHSETLRALIEVGASRNDQQDKDLALVGAARSGNVDAAKALIGYGANPNVDLSKLTVIREGGEMIVQKPGFGSILISAAESGNPEMVRELLLYQPELEAHDQQGKTAMFSGGIYTSSDQNRPRVECLRLLAKAGANVNARDNYGNTPLHETYLTAVEEELLKLGADVNARNKDGETPIFTTFNDDNISLFIKHGADLSIRNNKGETVAEAAQSKGPSRQEALRKAMQTALPH